MREIDLTARSDESMRELLAPAARALKEGRLVVLPTTTYYALSADATNADAVRRVFAAKKRDASKPLIVARRFLRHDEAVRARDTRVRQGT